MGATKKRQYRDQLGGMHPLKPEGLFAKSGDLREDEKYKSRLQELRAIGRSFDAMDEENKITGTASKGAKDRHNERIKKALNKGAAQFKAIKAAGKVDDALIDEYGKFARRARSLMRAATQTRATKPKPKRKTKVQASDTRFPSAKGKAMGGPVGYSQRWKTGRKG